MIRIFLSAIVVILGFLALAFVWFTNPLYTFVAGVLMLVIVIVGISLVINLGSEDSAVREDEAELQPRRTGEFRRVRSDEQPEDIWDNSTTSTGISTFDDVQWLGDESSENNGTNLNTAPEHNPFMKPVDS